MKSFEKFYGILNPIADLLVPFKKQILSLKYYKCHHKFINWKNPVTFHEKVFWLSMNTDTTKWSVLADKYAVRKFVADKCGDDVLCKLLGVYSSPEDIDFHSLPNSFVIKTNNACLTNILVREKSKLDEISAKRTLNKWLKLKYGALSAQPHYSRIKPMIIIEEYLKQDDYNTPLIDYKFFCFNGIPEFCMVNSSRIIGSHLFNTYIFNMNWEIVFSNIVVKNGEPIPSKPMNLENMVSIAKSLSENLKFVRVDLYNIQGKPIFGELTFTPALYNDQIESFINGYGALIDISTCN